MTTRLLASKPWPRLTELASRHRADVAVPFIGKGAAGRLPLKAGSVLITRLDETTVRQGQVHPGEILRLIRAGVEVHARHDLHAKVYVFGRRAVVGSANLSDSSAALVEACLETTDPRAVADARAFVLGLRSVSVGPEQVKQLLPLYPKDAPGRRRGVLGQPGPKHFVIPVHYEDWSDAEEAADAEGEPRAIAEMSDESTHRLQKVPLTKRDAAAMAEQDIVWFRWAAGRGHSLEPPAVVVHKEPCGRGAIVYAEVKKRQRRRSSTDVRAALGQASGTVLYPTSSVRQVRDARAIQALLGLWLTTARRPSPST